ncbi:MAG TPA: MerR family transcriptional regulator [Chloroflexia bacterium]|nr:MerR family transcriptional regulator [Chloroflexia bacterium]
MSTKLRIGELAEKAGVTTRTIRYYESLGLLGPNEREGKGFRYYTDLELARLRKIDTLKELGLSLEEISEVIDLYFTDDTEMLGRQRVIEILQHHLNETQDKIRALQRFETDLEAGLARAQQCFREAQAKRKAAELVAKD